MKVVSKWNCIIQTILKQILNFIPMLVFRIRKILLRRKNVFIGENTIVGANVKFYTEEGGKIIIGDGCRIFDGVILHTYGGIISLGDRSTLNPYCVVYGHGGLVIGSDVSIAAHTVIVPSNHNFTDKQIAINQQGETSKGIKIEQNCWIGAGVRILDGVNVGVGCVIGAGSVVTRSVEPYSIYTGSPDKKVRKY